MTIIQPTLNEEIISGSIDTFSSSRWMDFYNVSGIQQEIIDVTDELRRTSKLGCAITESYQEQLMGLLSYLGPALQGSDQVAVILPNRFTYYTGAYNALLDDYKFDEDQHNGEPAHVVMFPGSSITGFQALPYADSKESYSFRPVLNLRVQTSKDQPLSFRMSSFTHQDYLADNTSQTVPSPGHWYQFPLHTTSLASFNQF